MPDRPDHPAGGDCEALRPGLLAQPANAVSCLAYVGAGAVLHRSLRRRGPVDPNASLYCALLVGNGIGGLGFHGPGDRFSHWLHDVALVGTLGVVGVESVAAASGRELPRSPAALALAGGAAVGLALAPSATNVASVVGTVVVAGSEGAGVAAGRGHARRLRRAGAVLVVAGIVNGLSRTGAPCCRPRSRWQGHALWHVLTAWSMFEWGRVAFAAEPAGDPNPSPGPGLGPADPQASATSSRR